MRVLITGGAGFIGSHLADHLLASGHEVRVLDDLSTGRTDNLTHLQRRSSFSCVVGSVRDERIVEELIDRVDVVYHLAAAVGVQMVVDAPLHTIETNVHGTETILRHAARRRTPVLVASTSEVYGKGTALPFHEGADLVIGAPTKGRWGYATSKLLDEFLALAYHKEHRVPVTIVRLFNTVGPRQSDRYGMVLPTFVRQALAGSPLTVHGDGSQTRCFTWVGDVVSALVNLMAEPRAVGQIFNVGSDEEVSIRELSGRVCQIARSRSALEFVPHEAVFDDAFEDMPRRVPDTTKLKALLGSSPQVRLDEIISRTVQFWLARTSSTERRSLPSVVFAKPMPPRQHERENRIATDALTR